MAATQEYSQIIREISQVVPLHARTTDFNRNKYEIPLEIVVPNDPEGQQVVAVARILCIGCQLRGICSTLPNPETLSFTETTNYIRSKAIMRERPDLSLIHI